MSSIFVSYRRSASKHLARLLFERLRSRGYDVFLDITTIDSGKFDRIILNQIAARPHFLLVLSKGALERCANEGDWLRREIEEAFRLNRNIVPIYDEGFDISQEKQYLPEPIRTELSGLNALPYSNYFFDAFVDTLCTRFLKLPEYEVVITPIPQAERTEVARRIDATASTPFPAVIPERSAPKRPTALDIMPKPFAWIEVPVGKVTLEEGGFVPAGGQTFDVPAFAIAKYPTTNAQFSKFIEAGGYEQKKWWTKSSWKEREKEKDGWKEPLYWQDKRWNQADYPVVGVTWFDAVAFCLWLSEITGENITLPTEQQWQRAAQGNDNRTYPWGNQFDENRCNNDHSRTTPVTNFEGKGDSPFGVVDMAGNAREWCLTEYKTGHTGLDGTETRIVRGGSVYNSQDLAPVSYRDDYNPFDGDFGYGFRVVSFPIEDI